MIDIFQRIQILTGFDQQSGVHIGKQRFDGRQHHKGIAEGDQIPGIGRLVADLAQQTFQIIDRVQIFAQLVPVHISFAQHFHRVQPQVYLFFVDQRLFDIFAQQTAAHGGFRAVQYAQQRTLLLFLPQSLRQLQIPPGSAVKQHVLADQIRIQMRKMRQRRLLCLVQIFKQRPGGDHAGRKILDPQPGKGTDTKMLHQVFAAALLVKIVGCKRIDRDPQPVFQVLNIVAADKKLLVADDLGRRVFLDLVLQLAGVVHFCQIVIARRHIGHGNTCFAGRIYDTENIVVLTLVQRLQV